MDISFIYMYAIIISYKQCYPLGSSYLVGKVLSIGI